MKLKITIIMDNAAFHEAGGPNLEAKDILRELADKIEEGAELCVGYCQPLRDVNGNRVGEAKVIR